MSQIKIFLNGEEKIINNNVSVAGLILQLGLDVKKIAIEKDLEILQPEKFSETFLQDGARLEIVHFIGGG